MIKTGRNGIKYLLAESAMQTLVFARHLPTPLFYCHSVLPSRDIYGSSVGVFFLMFLIFMLFDYSCPNFSPFVLLHPSHPPLSHCRPCPWVIRTCSLSILSPSFHHYQPPLSLLVTDSLFHVSMPLVLFCSLVYFVH